MSVTKTPDLRWQADDLMASWRFWKSVHTWLYIILGAVSSAVSTFVAINAKYDILRKKYAWIPALLAAVFTFVISALGAQAEARSFEIGARQLEKALVQWDTDPDFGDLKLGETMASAIGGLGGKA